MPFTVQSDGKLPAGAAAGRTWVQVDDDSLRRPVWLRVAVADDGRLICTGLLIDSDPERELTVRELRRVRLPEILLTPLNRAAKSPQLRRLLGQQAAQRARPGRRGYPDEHYQRVARAYQKAKRQHLRAPIRALMGELHVSEPTVHRWLRTARERGFLESEREEE